MLRLPARWRSAGQARLIVANQLKARHFLRLHAFMLFGWTFGIAYLMSQLAFASGIPTLSERYLLTGTTGYLAFLLGVRIWLWYVDAMNERSGTEINGADALDIVDVTSDVASVAADGVGDVIGGIGEGIGSAGEGCLPILLVGLAALVAVLLVWLFGPELLIEIAFEAVLAGSLVGTMRLGREPDWLSAAFRKTILIFLGILFAMLVFGRYAQKRYPQATTTRQVMHHIMHRDSRESGHVMPQ